MRRTLPKAVLRSLGLVLIACLPVGAAQPTIPSNSHGNTSDLKSLTMEQLFAEGTRLFNQYTKALKAANSNEALATLERIAPLQREFVSRSQRAYPDDNETLRKFRSDLSGSLAWLADRYREREDVSAELELRRESVLLLTKLHGQDHWRLTDARLAVRHVQLLQRLTPQQRSTLSEADRLNAQVVRFYGEGKFQKALPLAAKVAQVHRAILGEKHPDYATSLQHLALLYESIGEYTLAQPLYQQALDLRKAVLGEKHPDYATSLNNLGKLFESIGESERAEPLLRQALQIRKGVLGEMHPSYATSLSNLAGLYESMGAYARAEPLYRQASAIRKAVLGDEHPEYGQSLNNLALLYHSMGEYAQAEPLYRKALVIDKAVLGEKHPNYACSLNNLALLFESMGEYARAEPLYRQALEIHKAVLGEKHPDYANSLNNLAGGSVSDL